MYLLNYILIGTGLLGLLSLTTIASNRNTGKYQKLICTLYNKTLITNHSCTTKAVNRYKKIIGAAAFLSHPVHDIMIHAKIYKKSNVVYKPFLVDVKENVCDALAKKPGAAPYTKIILGIYASYCNLNHTCPYEGWVMTKNVEIDFGNLELVIPSGEYRLNVTATLNKSKAPTFSVELFFEIGEKDFMMGKR